MTQEAPEFSRIIGLHEWGDGTRARSISATPDECAALARRFGLRSLSRLDASAQGIPDASGCRVTGTLSADLVQACVATDEDVPANLETTFEVRFVRGYESGDTDEEGVELNDEDCDVLPLEEDRIDLGETVAQTLAVNLDPYPRLPDADKILRELGVLSEEEAGPFAALKALKLGKDASKD